MAIGIEDKAYVTPFWQICTKNNSGKVLIYMHYFLNWLSDYLVTEYPISQLLAVVGGSWLGILIIVYSGGNTKAKRIMF